VTASPEQRRGGAPARARPSSSRRRRPMRPSGFSTCSSEKIRRSQSLPSPSFRGHGGGASARERSGSAQSGRCASSDFSGWSPRRRSRTSHPLARSRELGFIARGFFARTARHTGGDTTASSSPSFQKTSATSGSGISHQASSRHAVRHDPPHAAVFKCQAHSEAEPLARRPDAGAREPGGIDAS
jgi:hypothetical protein